MGIVYGQRKGVCGRGRGSELESRQSLLCPMLAQAPPSLTGYFLGSSN